MRRKILIICVIFLSAGSAFAQEHAGLLEKYREMALSYNHDLKAAEKNISASIELERAARAGRLPKISGGADFKYTGNPIALSLELPALGNPVTFEGSSMQYGASLSLLQPVYTGEHILESIKLAGYQRSFAVNQSEMFRSVVCYQTDIQYWNTVARQEIVKVAAEYRNSIASLAKTITERVEAGFADPQDRLMAEVKLNEAEYRLLQAESEFETGRMALNSLIGEELQTESEIEETIPKVILPENLLEQGEKIRPEIKMAQDQVKIAESRSRLADAKYKPQFYIGADGSYSSPGYNFRPDMDPNYVVYAKLSVPLFEWGKRRNEKKASSYKTGMAKDNLDKIMDNVDLEVRTAAVSLIQAVERVNLTESSLNKACENERKALERYGEGKISVVEVIEAQTYRQTTQLNNVQARVSAQGYYSQLIKALNLY